MSSIERAAASAIASASAIAIAIAIALVGVVAACGSFGEGGGQAASTPDAATDAATDGAPGDEAGADETLDCSAAGVVYCETFRDRASVDQVRTSPFSLVEHGSVLLVGRVGERDRAIAFTAEASDAGTPRSDVQIKLPFDVTNLIEVTVTMKIVDAGVFTPLTLAFDNSDGVADGSEYYIYMFYEKGFLVLGDVLDGVDGTQYPRVGSPVKGKAHAITLRLDVVAQKLEAYFDGAPSAKMDTRVRSSKQFLFQYGIFSGSPRPLSTVEYDDIRVITR